MDDFPNWSYWRQLGLWKLSDGVCLSLNLEPTSDPVVELFRLYYHEPTPRDHPSKKDLAARMEPYRKSLFDRLNIVKSHLLDLPLRHHSPNSIDHGMLPADFVKFAINLKWEELPGEFQDIALPQQETELSSLRRERVTLLKLVLGMAIAKYDYDAANSRNKATGEKAGSIAADLINHELPVDADTIRKYLDEAKASFK